MSAYICDRETISKIVNLICSVKISGYNGYGFDLPATLDTALADCRDKYGDLKETEVYARLYQMNCDAVGARYGRYDDMESDPDYRDYVREAHVHRPTREVEPWHYQMVKTIECYLYQCTEGDVDERQLYKGICQLRDCLMWHIVSESKEYREAEWG